MASMQKEDREIVTGVIKDISDFTAAINDVMSRLKSAVSEMNDVWNDAQYDQFLNYIEDLDKSVKSDLGELEEAKQNLQNKLTIYD